MAKMIEISDELYEQLAGLAVRFDTPASVIQRLIEAKPILPEHRVEVSGPRTGDPALEVKEVKAITFEMANEACRFGDMLEANKVSHDEARESLVKIGMNRSSAHIYLYNFLALRRGKVFKRGMKVSDIELFLDYIGTKYGNSALELALEAFERHIVYAERAGVSSAKKRPLLKTMKVRLSKK